MIRLRRFDSPIRANAAAAFLRANGIGATVVGEHVSTAFGGGLARFFGVDLFVPSDTDKGEAERLLSEFEREPVEVGEGWEESALPDLSKLDASEIDVACPNCRVGLPLDATMESCPSCRTPVDVAAMIALKYGPDVLAGCFEDESVMSFALEVKAASCVFCGYNLRGLAVRGRCPECGSLYDIAGSVEGSP